MIAVLLGPAGMGINALLTSTTGLVSAFTNFGIGVSSVKNVSQSSQDEAEIARTVKILRIWMVITGLLGTAITIILAPILSRLSFDSPEHTLSFILLAITLVLYQMTAGENAILQGLRKVSFIVRVGLLNSVLSLATGFPLYYFFGNKGIVPAIIISAVLNWIVIRFFTNRLKLPVVEFPKKEEIKSTGFSMMKIGLLVSMSGLITVFCSYLIRIYIGKYGSVADVGLYTAGFGLVSTYVGMILNAISADYYPRLAGVAHDNQEAEKVMNQQAEVTMLMLTPILVLLIVFVKVGLIILYSNKFLAITQMVQWAALGVFFQCISWIFAYIFLSKADSKAFFWNELVITFLMLTLNIFGYKYLGLTGLGVAFFLQYFTYLFQTFFIIYKKYKIKINSTTTRILGVEFLILFVVFCVSIYNIGFVQYIFGGLGILLSFIYSYLELDKRIHIKEIISNRLERLKK